MRQLQLFTTAQLAAMRDRTASRNYSPERDAFRREHQRHRTWGLVQRHSERLRRTRDRDHARPLAVTDTDPHRRATRAPAPTPGPAAALAPARTPSSAPARGPGRAAVLVPARGSAPASAPAAAVISASAPAPAPASAPSPVRATATAPASASAPAPAPAPASKPRPGNSRHGQRQVGNACRPGPTCRRRAKFVRIPCRSRSAGIAAASPQHVTKLPGRARRAAETRTPGRHFRECTPARGIRILIGSIGYHLDRRHYVVGDHCPASPTADRRSGRAGALPLIL